MDAAFKTAKFPGCTTDYLRLVIKTEMQYPRALRDHDHLKAMQNEIDRRERVASGDYSVATDGERLRAVREGKIT